MAVNPSAKKRPFSSPGNEESAVVSAELILNPMTKTGVIIHCEAL